MITMNCIKCGLCFDSQEKIFPYYNSEGILMGYLCEKCRHILPEIKCPSCGKEIQGEKGNGTLREDDKGNLHLDMELRCPHCSQMHIYDLDMHIHRKALKPGSVENMYREKMLSPSDDPNIMQVQDFLKKDYQLVGFHINWNNKVTTISMDFVKGNDKQSKEFSDCSSEFQRYVSCFHYVRDENLRSKLIFIDPGIFYKNAIPPQRNLNGKIEISGYTFTDFFAYPVIHELDKSSKFTFEIEVGDGKNQQFELVDYREPLNLFIDNKIAFVGNIFAAAGSPDQKLLRIFCLGISSQLNASRINLELNVKRGCGMDIAALVLDMSQIQYDIQDLHCNMRNFEVYIPIIGLTLSDRLLIGKVEFIQKLPSFPLLSKSQPFQKKTSYAHISLKCSKLYSALENALKFIQGAISLMNFRIKIPTFLNTYHLEDQNCCLRLGDVIYCQDVEYGTEIILNLPWLISPNFEKSVLIDDFFKPICKLANNLLNPGKALSPELEKLSWIFYYLNLAETSVNRTVAFQHLWVAFDFLVSFTELDHKSPFLRTETKDVRAYCEDYVEKRMADPKLIENFANAEKDTNKIKESLTKAQCRLLQIFDAFFNKLSEMQQIDLLLEKYSIPLSEKEQELLKTARKKRNDIIHGKKNVIVTRSEYNILSKLIYFILNRLEGTKLLSQNN